MIARGMDILRGLLTRLYRGTLRQAVRAARANGSPRKYLRKMICGTAR